MRSRNSIRSRLLALSMSTLVASTGAACFLYFREPPPTGQLEDDGWFGHLLDRRSVPLASRPTTGEELLVRDEADRAALFRVFGERLNEAYV